MYYKYHEEETEISYNQFEMPKHEVMVCVEFTKADYDVNKAETSNGSFEVKNSSGAEIAKANYQDVITIGTTPDAGFIVDQITVTDADNGSVTVTNGTFSMPAKGVTVSVTFKAQSSGPNPPDYNIEKW